MKTIIFCVVFITTCCYSEIRQIHIITRHGDRTGFNNVLPNAPVDWEIGEQRLTGLGVQQCRTAGSKIRMKYENLVKNNFHPSLVKAEASTRDRTLMSATAFLQGMFPDPIEIESDSFQRGVSSRKGNLINGAPFPVWQMVDETRQSVDNYLISYHYCPKLDSDSRKSGIPSPIVKELWNSPEFLRKMDEYRPFAEEIINITGLNKRPDYKGVDHILHNWYDSVYDPLHVQKIHGRLGNITELITDEVMRKVYEIVSWYEGATSSGKKLGRLAAGPLVDLLFKRTEQKKLSKKSKNVYLYGGHDSTLMNVMSAMGVKYCEARLPPYSSYLVIELHQEDEEWYVRLAFNIGDQQSWDNVDESQEVIMTDYCESVGGGCEADAEGKCPWKCWERIAKDGGLSIEQWKLECAVGDKTNFTS